MRDDKTRTIDVGVENPETWVYAAVDPDGSEAHFPLPDDGDLENVVKAIGLLVLKVSLQTDKDPTRVAYDAAGMADHLMKE